MNKILFFALMLCASAGIKAQVGIGTAAPSATTNLDIVPKAGTTSAIKIGNGDATAVYSIDASASTKPILLPKVTNVSSISAPTNGMLVYENDAKCVKSYANGNWIDVSGDCVPSLSALNCDNVTNNGTLTQGVVAAGVSSVVGYTGGDGITTYGAQAIASTGVTGLTATLVAGTFALGSGTLTYTIAGTPSAAGTATFPISVGGFSCAITRAVKSSITVPATITLKSNKIYTIVSAYDLDYLPYTLQTELATTARDVAADGSPDTTINIQGTLTTTGVTMKIPVTATGASNLPAYSNTITIPANLTEDGISRDVTLSWPLTAYTAATTFITATIKSVGGALNLKRLDLNVGLGSDGLGVLFGSINYPYNNTGNLGQLKLRIAPAIADRMFGKADNNSNDQSHSMLYFPVIVGATTWLNNNLGAAYADINNQVFNPLKQATSFSDNYAYGSLLQWGRRPDGHELIVWIDSNTATPLNPTLLTGPGIEPLSFGGFITDGTPNNDWRSPQDDNLWLREFSNNNPCPLEYRVPTIAELTALGFANSAAAYSSVLKFTGAAARGTVTGNIGFAGTQGRYWSSSISASIQSWYRYYDAGVNSQNISDRVDAVSVRCIKD